MRAGRPPGISKGKLDAIIEALCSRLAGERDNQDDPEAPTDEDYENALTWAIDQRKRFGE